MLYLLDANVVITAERDYYSIEQVPEFWEWLLFQASQGNVKQPSEIFDEVMRGGRDPEKDPLIGWLKGDGVKQALVLDEEADAAHVQRAVTAGYAPDLTDTEIENIGRDPFLIAYGLADPDERVIVTGEVSRPSMKRQNRRLPDVCNTLGIRHCTLFEMNRQLKFTTSWKRVL